MFNHRPTLKQITKNKNMGSFPKKYKGSQRLDVVAKDLVDYEAGKTIFEVALGVYKKKNENQIEINF